MIFNYIKRVNFLKDYIILNIREKLHYFDYFIINIIIIIRFMSYIIK